MRPKASVSVVKQPQELLRRLRRDEQGNTLALIAAALFPLLGLVGGGIDMGRSYLAQSRLQQACDAGVLAARKKLGSTLVTDGNLPADVGTIGDRFFNVNFRAGSYGTENRDFQMELEEDHAISGVATVEVPTTIMTLFGYEEMPLTVNCQAQLNFSNADIMFVLDATGSMLQTNDGDDEPRIDILRTVVKGFHAQLEGSKTPGTTVRYGFVPYSTNVNVGALLKDEWVVDEWDYQSREVHKTDVTPGTQSFSENWTKVSGSATYGTVHSSYPATWNPPSGGSSTTTGGEVASSSGGGGSPGYYSCNGAQPADTFSVIDNTKLSERTEAYAGPPAGTKTIERYVQTYIGDDYYTALVGTTCEVRFDSYDNEKWEFDWSTIPTEVTTNTWFYRKISRDVTNWRTETNGCMEERETYEVNDWDSVDLGKALDLDIDTVPTAGQAKTQWRPQYPNIIWERELTSWNTGSFSFAPVQFDGDFFQPRNLPSLVACPRAALKLAEMTTGEVETYLDSISPAGTTYHDIGMIWGGRLLSPTGLFAAENAGVAGRATSRHLIFLTDGKTETYDIAYGAYGVEPLDRRRWTPGGTESLDETVEKRFSFACEEVKKRNITVWVIGFGVGLDDFMTKCAGPGRYFEAADAGQLEDAFENIASQLGDLRISK